ncbi:MAG: xylulose kinase [Hadesarchaea archaeon DG-33]|nr:MAG: xylulose kinase [Hadesarchaea archaeon DG-33]
MSHLIGIDVGTTGVKVLLINEKGLVVSRAFMEYPLHIPQLGWAEQNPENWWDATVKGVKKVLEDSVLSSEEVTALGLTGQMHGSVFLDKKNHVLRPAILWCDQRTASQCAEITEKIGRDRLIQLTCNPTFTGFTAPKILWVRENEPDIYKKSNKILLPKDYIRFKLTGDYATDVSDASGTSLLDVKKRKWSEKVLDELNIREDLLPKVYESPEITGEISREASASTGLKLGTPVVGGAGDNAAGAVGSGVIKEGVVWASIGTSGVVFASCDKPKTDPKGRIHTFCHAVPKKWHLMGVMLSAGGSLRWFRDNLGGLEIQAGKLTGEDPYVFLDAEASRAEPGCKGLIFLPYLAGERTPHGDPNARGVFFGLTLHHGKPHLVRSVMEGVAYGMRDSLGIMKGLGIKIDQIRALGGGARSNLWRQIQADVYGAELVTINVEEGPAFGAALLAGVGAKVYSSIGKACERTIKKVSRTEPIKENLKIYDKYYEIYKSLYPALKSCFDKIVGITVEG